MYDRVISENSFMILYCPDKCKTQRICDVAVEDCLTLKFANWFVTSKMIKKLLTALNADYNIHYFSKDSDNLNNINLDNTNYDEDDSETIISIRLQACHIKFEERKVPKKELHDQLMLILWYPRRWRSQLLLSNAYNIYKMEVLKHFA